MVQAKPKAQNQHPFAPQQAGASPSYSSRLLLITHISLMWSISSSSVRSTPYLELDRGGGSRVNGLALV